MLEDILKKKNISTDVRVTRLSDFNHAYASDRKKKIIKKILIGIFAIVLVVGIWYGARANQVMENISTNDGSFIQRILHLLPLENSFAFHLPVETSILEEPNTIEKRVNILILGMRGQGDPNGGLLADSSIIVSVRPYDNKIALISVPRDLFVFMPGVNESRKLNEAYETGEKLKPGKGLEYTKSIFSNVSGVPVHFAVIVNFKAFKDLVDSLGGVDLNLARPFIEAVPFEEGSINLPAGRQTIDGETALLYTRARMSSSDFDRSRRQQEVIKAIFTKITKTGIILNPYRLNKLLSIMEANTKTDMQVWEMEEMIKIFAGLKDTIIKTKVIDNGAEKLLYSAHSTQGAFILLPTGDDYTKIHDVFKNIFNQD
jgi:LCP family protein required for cell wall assembly